MNYTIKTNIKTLKGVWNTLKDVELDGLLSGGSLDIGVNVLLDRLLLENKLNEVCQIITGENTDFEDIELSEVISILTSFFTSIGKVFQGLNGLVTANMKSEIGVLQTDE